MKKNISLILIFVLSFNIKLLAWSSEDSTSDPDIRKGEIGDVLYQSVNQMWGRNNNYDFPDYIGHAAFFIGTDENDNKWIIEAIPNTTVDYNQATKGELKKYNTATLTNNQRKNLAIEAINKIGSNYVDPFQNSSGNLVAPSLSAQKGGNDGHFSNSYTCIGLVEKIYENKSIYITPDTQGRSLISGEQSPLDTNWNENEGSWVEFDDWISISSFPWYWHLEFKTWVFFPYTQWYKQTHRNNSSRYRGRFIHYSHNKPKNSIYLKKNILL
jgi:hypothetical protein